MALNPLSYIYRRESGGKNVRNYMYDRTHTASGIGQITNSTWRTIPTSVRGDYSTAESAPLENQAAASAYLYNRRGFADWAPFNPALKKDIAAAGGESAFAQPGTLSTDPADYRDSIDGPGGSTSSSSGNSAVSSGTEDSGISFDAPGSTGGDTGDYGGGSAYADTPEGFKIDPYGAGEGVDPWTPGGYSSGGKELDPAATPGGSAPTGSGGGLPAILGYTWDKLLRVGLILLGIVLVAVAAWGMVRGEFDPVSMATAAAKKGIRSA